MASDVFTELDKANPNNVPDLLRLGKAGSGLHQTVARFHTDTVGTVTANILTLPTGAKARQILRCWVTVGGSTGNKTVAVAEATPGAGACAVNQNGDIEFAAADAVTQAEVTYIPVEGELVSETIPVTAGGAGTFLRSKRATMLMSASLNAPAAAPGASIIDDRGTGAAAGHAQLTVAGTGVEFNAADCTAVCSADVTYYAVPGVGTGVDDDFGARLEADFTP